MGRAVRWPVFAALMSTTGSPVSEQLCFGPLQARRVSAIALVKLPEKKILWVSPIPSPVPDTLGFSVFWYDNHIHETVCAICSQRWTGHGKPTALCGEHFFLCPLKLASLRGFCSLDFRAKSGEYSKIFLCLDISPIKSLPKFRGFRNGTCRCAIMGAVLGAVVPDLNYNQTCIVLSRIGQMHRLH